MDRLPFWSVEVDKLVASSTELTAEEFGAYVLLMIRQWQNAGRSLPDNDHKLARICRMTTSRWKKHVRPAIEKYFDVRDGTWSQKKLAKQFEEVVEKIRKKRESGARGGKAKARKAKERALANAINSPYDPAGTGKNENSSDRLPKDELEGRRISPPLNREGGNPSSAYGGNAEDNAEPSSNGNDGNGLQENRCSNLSTDDEKDDDASKFFEGRRPSDNEFAAWNQALQTLRIRSESRDYTYLQPLEMVAVDGNTVTLSAPTQLIHDRASEISGRIRDALQDAGLAIATVHIEISNISAGG